MLTKSGVVQIDPKSPGGRPLFAGTQVPVQSLFDFLEGGETVADFLKQFPSVSREQAVAALALARESLLADARRETRSWPDGFFAKTFGSLAEDPLARGSQNEQESRENLL